MAEDIEVELTDEEFRFLKENGPHRINLNPGEGPDLWIDLIWNEETEVFDMEIAKEEES